MSEPKITECPRCKSQDFTSVDGSSLSTLWECNACRQQWETCADGTVEIPPNNGWPHDRGDAA